MPLSSRDLPNALSILRLVSAAGLLPAALLHQAPAFWVLLGVALASDVADGWLARRLGVSSELGRRLDSAGDYATALLLFPSLWILWPARTRLALPWLAVIATAYFAPTVIAWMRWRIIPAYHTWAAKGAAAVTSTALLLLYAVESPVLLPLAALAQVIAAGDELLIGRARPGWTGSVRSSIHARRAVEG